MAVARYTLTGSVADLTGTTPTNYASVAIYVETNLPTGEAVIDTTGNKIMPGVLRLKPAADGTFSVSLISTADDPAVQPNNRQYRVRIDMPSQRLGSRTSRETWDSGWFNLTANSDLADVVVVDYVPVTWMTSATATLQGYVDDAHGYADDAAASAQQAHDISGIATPDGVVAALVPSSSGSATSAALTATYVRLSGTLDGGTP